MESDLPVRLVPSCLNDPGMQRRERSWTLIAGSHRWSFTRIDHHVASYPRPAMVVAAPAPARRWSLTGMIAVVLGTGVALATLGLALNASRAATGAYYVLSISLPAAAPFKPVGRGHRSPSPVRRPIATDAPAVVAMAPPPPIDVIMPSDLAPAAAMTMRSAINAAAKTGALQEWASADGAEHGFVVAGPAEQGCRTLSILTRRDGDDRVTARRECNPAGAAAATP